MTVAPADRDSADMHALQQGNDAALNRLMSRWEIPLRNFLFRYTQNEHDAMECALETFVRIHRHRQRFRLGQKFSTWMFQIALNLARDRARAAQRRPQFTTLDETPEPAGAQSPLGDVIESEKANAVRDAIADLPADLREAILLFEYEQKSHAEIADIVGTTPKGVETRLYRARGLLKKSLSRFFRTG
ncbi:MAG: RNA polymerase sigma factor [Magnetospirillum sp.]|nr:RNA polymerase sigma factor [Magnetospirillum sp.]